MMTKPEDMIRKFVETWNCNRALRTATTEEILETEAAIGLTLPFGYKTLVSVYGDVYTPDILDAVVDQNLDLPDVQNFNLPGEALEDTTLYVSAGMPEGYLGFASDSGGSMFCFSLEDLADGTGDSAVWFFDHDFVDMTRQSDSFLEWLRIYTELERG
jgi:hypothetical protein